MNTSHRPGRVLLLALLSLLMFTRAAAQSGSETEKTADALLGAGKWEEAATAYAELVKLEPGNGRAWTRMGVSLYSAGQYARAVEALRRADELKFNRHMANYLLARAYSRLGDKEKALDALSAAVGFGFANKQLFDGDQDLSPLRDDARFKEIAAKVERAARPCVARPEHHHLDFWIGEWEQQNRDGTVVGSTSVKALLEGCVIQESTTNAGGYAAQALHYFDPSAGKWRQTYTDTRAGFSLWLGEFQDGEVRYAGEISAPDGTSSLGRNTITRVGPDRVHQTFEVSRDGGKTWSASWDGFYVRKK
jgi:tetratricopeptide (TPR) repeat protein